MIRLIVRYLPAALIGGLAAVGVPALLARTLGPQHFGEFCLIAAGVQFAFYATTYWLVSSLIRFAPEFKGPIKVTRTILVTVLISIGTAVVFVITIVPEVVESRLSPLTYLAIGMSVAAQGSLLVLAGIHRANERPLAYTLQKVATCGLPFVALLLLIWAGSMSLSSIFVALACSYLIVLLLLGLPFVQWQGATTSGAPPVRAMFIYGLPVAMTFFAEWVIAASDRFLIGAMIGVEQTGLYAAPYAYSEQFILFPLGLIQMALAPFNARVWHEQGQPAAMHMYSRQFDLITVTVIPAVVVVALLGRSILVLLGSEAYLPAASIMPWVAFAILFGGYQWVSQRPLMMQHRTLSILAAFLIAALINVAATTLLLRPFGIRGAAIGTAVAYVSLFLIMHAFGAISSIRWNVRWGRLAIVWVLAGIVIVSIHLPVLTGFKLLFTGVAIVVGSVLVPLVILFPGLIKRVPGSLRRGPNTGPVKPGRPTVITARRRMDRCNN